MPIKLWFTYLLTFVYTERTVPRAYWGGGGGGSGVTNRLLAGGIFCAAEVTHY